MTALPRLGRVLALAILAGLAACGFNTSGGAAGGDGGSPPADADPNAPDSGPPDARPDDPCLQWDPAAPFDPCMVAERGDTLILDGSVTYTFDTDAGTLAAGDGDPMPLPSELIEGDTIRLVSVERLEMGEDAVLRVVGSKPLLIASWSVIEVAGEIDLSSSPAGGVGAGGDDASCPTEPLAGDLKATGGGGGGGGGFGSAGGRGGDGAGPGPAAGEAGPAVTGEIGLRGGCPGGSGGGTVTGGEVPLGGSGGGAIALGARLALDVTGTIHAGGGGGAGGDSGALEISAGEGGAGGGSGGMIWLDAPTLTLGNSAVLAAQGGGGGEGGDANDVGSPGDPALQDGARAEGGKDAANRGGDGGKGDPDDGKVGENGKPGGMNEGGGGGGGGGAGIIRIDGTLDDAGAIIRPPAAPSIRP